MANLLKLPNEILLAILEVLAAVDLQSLLTAQRTNRRLFALVQDVLYHTQNILANHPEADTGEVKINPLWKSKFNGLFNTTDCFTKAEKRKQAFLTLNGDYTLPFRRLPWAQVESKCDAYFRPEASWHDISLTFGQAPITHLDVVKSYSAAEGDSVYYYQVDLPPSGMTMGLFYEVLLSDKATFGRETGSWELIVGRRLRSFDVLSEYECFIPDDRDLVDSGKEAHQAAILYVRGGPPNRFTSVKPAEVGWIAGNQTKQRLLPWQGPIQNFIFSGYYD